MLCISSWAAYTKFHRISRDPDNFAELWFVCVCLSYPVWTSPPSAQWKGRRDWWFLGIQCELQLFSGLSDVYPCCLNLWGKRDLDWRHSTVFAWVHILLFILNKNIKKLKKLKWSTLHLSLSKGLSAMLKVQNSKSVDCHYFVFEAVLCGDPGSPGEGFREGNIFSYGSVDKLWDFYMRQNALSLGVQRLQCSGRLPITDLLEAWPAYFDFSRYWSFFFFAWVVAKYKKKVWDDYC